MSCQNVYSVNASENRGLLQSLPTEVLLVIFKYCNRESLGRLSAVCKRFNIIVSDDSLWLKSGRQAIVTNQLTTEIQNRSPHRLSQKERCRISHNWKKGRYKSKVYTRNLRFMPWVSLDSNILWISQGIHIRAYKRKSVGIVDRCHVCLVAPKEDVCQFVNREGMIVSVGSAGEICGWVSDSGRLLFNHVSCHTSTINAVDLRGQVLVSGARDQSVKVWSMSERKKSQQPVLDLQMGDRVWSLAIAPHGDLCCVGTAGHYQVPPLHIYSLQSGVHLFDLHEDHRRGAGALTLQWESPHTLLSGGYDTCVRLWDIRTGHNVFSWEDPHDSAIYCLQSDCSYTILSGTARHGRVQLWDKRMRRGVQMYYMCRGGRESPVYSLAFDPCHLFAATDRSLHVLSFTGFNNWSLEYM